MQPVNTILEIEKTYGTIGFSFLRRPIFGQVPTRETVLYIRDTAGLTASVVILPAESLRGSF